MSLNSPADIISISAVCIACMDVLVSHAEKYLRILRSENALTARRNTQKRECWADVAVLTILEGSVPLWPFWYSMIECNTAEPGIVHVM